MNILCIQETDWIKRGPHQQHHLLERLADRGHTVRVIDYEFLWQEDEDPARLRTRTTQQAPTQVIDDADLELIRPGMVKAPLLDMASIPVTHRNEINHQLKEFDPDVVVGLGILNAYLGARAARTHDVPFVYYVIDHLHRLLENRALEVVAKQVEKRTLRLADEVYVLNEGLADYAASFGAPREKITVLPGGVDYDQYQSADGSQRADELGLEDEHKVLFFMGWLYEFSGLKEVAERFAARQDEFDDYRLLICGDGDLYDELRQIRDTKLQDKLLLPGEVPFETIPEYLDLADVCLLPAYHNDIMDDIVPIKMYEYLASESPVVARDLPGIHKEFETGNGVVYVDDSADAFDRAVELIESGEYESLGTTAANYVERNDWEALTNEFKTDLQSLIKQQRATVLSD